MHCYVFTTCFMKLFQHVLVLLHTDVFSYDLIINAFILFYLSLYFKISVPTSIDIYFFNFTIYFNVVANLPNEHHAFKTCLHFHHILIFNSIYIQYMRINTLSQHVSSCFNNMFLPRDHFML